MPQRDTFYLFKINLPEQLVTLHILPLTSCRGLPLVSGHMKPIAVDLVLDPESFVERKFLLAMRLKGYEQAAPPLFALLCKTSSYTRSAKKKKVSLLKGIWTICD